MHTVDREQHPIAFIALGVGFGDASAILRTGSLSPVLECTQVTASRRVFGVRALTTLPTISSSEMPSSFS
jgi:hypothetical protein